MDDDDDELREITSSLQDSDDRTQELDRDRDRMLYMYFLLSPKP